MLASNKRVALSFPPHLHGVRVLERAGSVVHICVRRIQPAFQDVIETFFDGPFVSQEIGDRGVSAQGKIHAVKIARPRSGQGQRGFPQSLAGHSAGVDAGAAQLVMIVHQRDGFSKSGRCGRTDNAGRSAAENNQIVVFRVTQTENSRSSTLSPKPDHQAQSSIRLTDLPLVEQIDAEDSVLIPRCQSRPLLI